MPLATETPACKMTDVRVIVITDRPQAIEKVDKILGEWAAATWPGVEFVMVPSGDRPGWYFSYTTAEWWRTCSVLLDETVLLSFEASGDLVERLKPICPRVELDITIRVWRNGQWAWPLREVA